MKVALVLNNPTQPIPINGMDWYRLVLAYYPVNKGGEHTIVPISQDRFDLHELDYDCYVLNRSRELFRAQRVKDVGKKLIIDIDDYWELPTWHPMNPDVLQKKIKAAEANPKVKIEQAHQITQSKIAMGVERRAKHNILESIRIADHVTCTVDQLRDEIIKHNPNCTVIRNTIPATSEYSKVKQRSTKLRFIYLGGTFHLRDVALMHEGITKLHLDTAERGKYQFAASFNNIPEYKEIEKIFTSNYRVVSPPYRELLQTYIPSATHMGLQEAYRRLWGVPVMEYGSLYENGDVALIPLQNGKFNSMKSELKLVEAAATGCAAIVSNVDPYKKWLKHGENCMIAEGKNGWYTAFKTLLNNPDLRNKITEGLAETMRVNFDNNTEGEKLKRILCGLASG